MIIRPVILLAVSATLLLSVVRRMRQQKLKERHALVFIFIAIPFLVLAVWPDAIELASDLLGISTFTVMLLGVSVFLILLIFELLAIVSVLDRKISTLAQMVGILNERMQLIEHRQQVDASCNLNQLPGRGIEIKTRVPPGWSEPREDSAIGKETRGKEPAVSSVEVPGQTRSK